VQKAALKWYAQGFALGAAGGKVSQRKARPRLRAMWPHWKKGVEDGAFVAKFYTRAYEFHLKGPDTEQDDRIHKMFGPIAR
jgi:hypothetical protein